MINQSLTFEITGQDASLLLKACQEQGIEPVQAFQAFLTQFAKNDKKIDANNDETLKAKKLAYAGILSEYANPELIPLEQYAVETAVKEKYVPAY